MVSDLKLFFRYVLPSMTGMVIAGTYCVVDTLFIGKAVGDLGLAALALTWPLIMMYGAVGDMLGNGAAIILSQSRGAKIEGKDRTAVANMITMAVVFSLFVLLFVTPCLSGILSLLGTNSDTFSMAYDYSFIMTVGCIIEIISMAWISVIRNDGHPKTAMFITSLGLVTNIVLDYVFMFPMGMGVKGAALASLVAQILIIIAGIVYFCSSFTRLRFRLQDFLLQWKMVWEILAKGFPSLGNQLTVIAMLALHNIQSLRYAGNTGVAAYALISTIEATGSLLMTGLSGGIQPLVAFLYGSGEIERRHRILRYGIWTALWLGVLLMVVSILGHVQFPIWFGLSGPVATMAGHGLILSAPAFLLLGIVRVSSYYFQATNSLFRASTLIYGDSFVALPLCLFALPPVFGIDGVWLAMPVSRLILFAILCCFWVWSLQRSRTE